MFVLSVLARLVGGFLSGSRSSHKLQQRRNLFELLRRSRKAIYLQLQKRNEFEEMRTCLTIVSRNSIISLELIIFIDQLKILSEDLSSYLGAVHERRQAEIDFAFSNKKFISKHFWLLPYCSDVSNEQWLQD